MGGDPRRGARPAGSGLGVVGGGQTRALDAVEFGCLVAGQEADHCAAHTAHDRVGHGPPQAAHERTHLLLADVDGDAPAQGRQLDAPAPGSLGQLLVGLSHAGQHLDEGLEVVLLVGDDLLSRLLVPR